VANGDDEGFYDVPVEEQQEFLYATLGFADDTQQDQTAHDLFWSFAYDDTLSYGERLQIYDEFAEYVYDEYGIDFELIWDWDAFREWYDAQ
jgi:hypothetical protein